MKKTSKTPSQKSSTSSKKTRTPSLSAAPASSAERTSTTQQASLETATARSIQPSVSFEFEKPEAAQVFVAGSFNGWKPESTPLQRTPAGRWIGKLPLSPGKHEYLFVVDGQWLPDPKAVEAVRNPFGGVNSVVSVAE